MTRSECSTCEKRGPFTYNPDWVEPSIEPEYADTETETNASDEPRDMTLFKPFLRPVNREDKGWGNTVWLMQLLNEERAKAGEPLAPHKNVLRGARTVMEKLGEVSRLNFESSEYMDIRGKTQPLIRFSDDVLLNVVAEVGGKVEHQLLHRANVAFNRLKWMERATAFPGEFESKGIHSDS